MSVGDLEKQSRKRFFISLLIISICNIGLAVTIVTFENALDPNTVFTAIVGLVGSWVGTVLTFYFSKDNFDAATKSTQDVIDKITSKNDLDSISAEESMIPLKDISFLKMEPEKGPGNYPLRELVSQYFSRRNRLPVLNAELYPLYILHRSLVDRFLAEHYLGPKEDDPTLDSLLKNYKDQMSAFVTVKTADSLNFAKSTMENASHEAEGVIVSDVFVTKNGSKKSEVIGWITNSLILEKSKI